MSDEEYKKLLKQYHKLSDRHILVVETDMPYPDVLKVVALSDKIRKAGNELVILVIIFIFFYKHLMMLRKYVLFRRIGCRDRITLLLTDL